MSNLGVTSIYLQGIDGSEVVEAIHQRSANDPGRGGAGSVALFVQSEHLQFATQTYHTPPFAPNPAVDARPHPYVADTHFAVYLTVVAHPAHSTLPVTFFLDTHLPVQVKLLPEAVPE